MDHLVRAMGVKLASEKMLKIFAKSTSLDDFVRRLNIPDADIQVFFRDFGNLARSDYDDMKTRYIRDSKNPDPDGD